MPKEEVKCNNILKQYKKKIYFDTKENIKWDNPNWTEIPWEYYQL